MYPTRSAVPARAALAVFITAALCATGAAYRGSSANATATSTAGGTAGGTTRSTAVVSLTFATGPSCYIDGMICGGPGIVTRKCCSNLTCTGFPGRKYKYCLESCTQCVPNHLACKPGGKKCCDPDAVCIYNSKPGLDGIVTTRCEKRCVEDDRVCAESPYAPDRPKPCCNPNYICRRVEGLPTGKFCSPR